MFIVGCREGKIYWVKKIKLFEEWLNSNGSCHQKICVLAAMADLNMKNKISQ